MFVHPLHPGLHAKVSASDFRMILPPASVNVRGRLFTTHGTSVKPTMTPRSSIRIPSTNALTASTRRFVASFEFMLPDSSVWNTTSMGICWTTGRPAPSTVSVICVISLNPGPEPSRYTGDGLTVRVTSKCGYRSIHSVASSRPTGMEAALAETVIVFPSPSGGSMGTLTSTTNEALAPGSTRPTSGIPSASPAESSNTVPFNARRRIGQLERTAEASTFRYSGSAWRFVAVSTNWAVVPMSAITLWSASRRTSASDGSWSNAHPLATSVGSSYPRDPPTPGVVRETLIPIACGVLQPTMSIRRPLGSYKYALSPTAFRDANQAGVRASSRRTRGFDGSTYPPGIV